MKKNTDRENKYGILTECDDEIIFAIQDEFSFDFIKKDANKYDSTQIVPQGGYVRGCTFAGDDIFILSNVIIPIIGKLKRFNTDTYIVGQMQETFAGIRFSGGTLNNLFYPKALEKDFEKGEIYYNYKNDEIKSSEEINRESWIFSVGSTVSESFGPSGTKLMNTEVVLDITKESGICLADVSDIIEAVRKMCQFMCFRKNVVFEHIHLLKEHDDSDFVKTMSVAEVFLKENKDFATEKDWHNNITFECLGENIGNLFKEIYSVRPGDMQFSLDFIPDDDKKAKWIKFEDVKSICTALEIEVDRQDIKLQKISEIKELTKEVKSIVKKYRKESDENIDKTYENIMQSISRWSYAANDGFSRLYKKYKTALINMNVFRLSEKDFLDELVIFVKMRNKMTHGTYVDPNDNMATIAAILRGLIYCSRLDSIGISKEIIEKILAGQALY